MTCYHVLDVNVLKEKEYIKFFFDAQSKEFDLNWDKYIRFIFTDPNLDITFIELFDEDFNFETNFLKYSLIDNYKNKNILIFQHPAGQKISYCEGQTLYMKKNDITHNVSTLPGSSGSALILKEDDNRVIGVHKSGIESKQLNQATPITTELIEKIKDFKKFSYYSDKIFVSILYEKKKIEFDKKIKNMEKNNEDQKEVKKEVLSLSEFLSKVFESLNEDLKKELIEIGEVFEKYKKAKFKLGCNKIDYLIDIMVNMKYNDSYKNYILMNENKFLADLDLDFIRNSGRYAELRDHYPEMTTENYCGRHYNCIIYYIIISYWFGFEDKVFFIEKALDQLIKEIEPLDRSDLWYHTKLVYIQSYILNEIGKKDESITKFNKLKYLLNQCQNDYNFELKYNNPNSNEFYTEEAIVRRRNESFNPFNGLLPGGTKFWIFEKGDIDRLNKNIIILKNNIFN